MTCFFDGYVERTNLTDSDSDIYTGQNTSIGTYMYQVMDI